MKTYQNGQSTKRVTDGGDEVGREGARRKAGVLLWVNSCKIYCHLSSYTCARANLNTALTTVMVKVENVYSVWIRDAGVGTRPKGDTHVWKKTKTYSTYIYHRRVSLTLLQ